VSGVSEPERAKPATVDAARALAGAVDAARAQLVEVARQIHAHPELCYQERFASSLLADVLERAGLKVERGAHGVETALRAEVGRAGATTVAVVAEYDALPQIGHACGHNLIATGALGATLALASLGERLPGRVVFIGAPAEEGGGGKIRLLKAGAFAGIDAAIMFHPFDRSTLWQPALAMIRLTVEFRGRPAHASMQPWGGASALRGVIQLFNMLDSARLHVRDGARMHGIITDGGQAVNIIPERAAAAFSLRAPHAAYLEGELMPMFRRCVEAAALATETTAQVTIDESYQELKNNLPIARRFGHHLAALGVPFEEHDATVGTGSTDMGDVSQAVPSIHPFLAICARGETTCHQRAFADCAASERGIEMALSAAKALALTAHDLLTDGELRAEAKRAFQAPTA
jgi:amidohydrolase